MLGLFPLVTRIAVFYMHHITIQCHRYRYKTRYFKLCILIHVTRQYGDQTTSHFYNTFPIFLSYSHFLFPFTFPFLFPFLFPISYFHFSISYLHFLFPFLFSYFHFHFLFTFPYFYFSFPLSM